MIKKGFSADDKTQVLLNLIEHVGCVKTLKQTGLNYSQTNKIRLSWQNYLDKQHKAATDYKATRLLSYLLLLSLSLKVKSNNTLWDYCYPCLPCYT